MTQTYKAILRGNQLEWSDAAPQTLADDRAIAVHVTILDDVAVATNPLTAGQRMSAILEQLAQQPTFASISDPIAWQREQRNERVLPDREG